MMTLSWFRTLALWALGLSAALAPSSARAQAIPPDLVALTVLAGPPTLVALVCDIGSIAHLSADGTAPRSFAINGLIFSGVDTGLSLLVLSVALVSNRSSVLVPLSEASVGLGGASLLLALYATFHPPKDPPSPVIAMVRTLRLAPWVSSGPAGALTTGGSLGLRW